MWRHVHTLEGNLKASHFRFVYKRLNFIWSHEVILNCSKSTSMWEPNAAATEYEETYLSEVMLVTCGCCTLHTYTRSIYSSVSRFFTSVFSRDSTTAVRSQQTCNLCWCRLLVYKNSHQTLIATYVMLHGRACDRLSHGISNNDNVRDCL